MNTPLRDLCQGRWQGILSSLGVDSRFLTGKHGPCPMCDGKDRYRFDDKDGRGTFICSKCTPRGGDGIAFAMALKGWDFKEAAQQLEALSGKAPRQTVNRERDQQSLRDAMNRLWDCGQPVVYGDAVSRYLDARGIDLTEYPKAIRFVEKCRFGDGQSFPAMVAKVTGPDGKPSTIHRTFIKPDGKERKLMPGKIAKGSAIRLTPVAPVLGIAEGIETALSASIIWNMPVWAAVSAGMLMEWLPPDGVQEVVIFADNDESLAGQAAAFALGHKLSARGITARVEMPIDVGMDWNDVLLAEKANPARNVA